MLTGVEIPEKVTKIGKGAFSQQWKVNLVDQSFKVTYPEGIEKIEAETFAAAGSPFLGKFPGVKTIQTEIPADAFRGNRLREVLLPPEITDVSESAFRDNVSSGRFIVESDNELIRPTKGYDVRRSDGTVFSYKGE